MIHQLQTPSKKTEKKSNYLRQFVPKSSDITSPLRALLKKDIQWTENHTSLNFNSFIFKLYPIGTLADF